MESFRFGIGGEVGGPFQSNHRDGCFSRLTVRAALYTDEGTETPLLLFVGTFPCHEHACLGSALFHLVASGTTLYSVSE